MLNVHTDHQITADLFEQKNGKPFLPCFMSQIANGVSLETIAFIIISDRKNKIR